VAIAHLSKAAMRRASASTNRRARRPAARRVHIAIGLGQISNNNRRRGVEALPAAAAAHQRTAGAPWARRQRPGRSPTSHCESTAFSRTDERHVEASAIRCRPGRAPLIKANRHKPARASGAPVCPARLEARGSWVVSG